MLYKGGIVRIAHIMQVVIIESTTKVASTKPPSQHRILLFATNPWGYPLMGNNDLIDNRVGHTIPPAYKAAVFYRGHLSYTTGNAGTYTSVVLAYLLCALTIR